MPRIEVAHYHEIRFGYGDSAALEPAVCSLRVKGGRRSYTLGLIDLCVELAAHFAQLSRKAERRENTSVQLVESGFSHVLIESLSFC
jgi:hypothetical protein